MTKTERVIALWMERRGYSEGGDLREPTVQYVVTKTLNTADYPPGHLYYTKAEIDEIIAKGIDVHLK